VRVAFKIKTGSNFGTRTGAQIKVKTLLGAMFLSLEPAGPGQLKKSLNTLAEATSGTPAAFRDTLKGLSALSANVAARDEQLNTLLGNLKDVSSVLAARDQDLVTLMDDSDELLRALVSRREAVHRLLVSTSKLSNELTALVRQSRADLKPALSNLQGVTDVLLKNQNNLDNSLRLMAPFYRVFTNVLGNGPWFENWIANLPPADGGLTVKPVNR
jgi:phospholipid/cholesterol/gamma-HCH transport system substrate-binding protein